MDNEIKDILIKLLEGLTRIETEINEMKNNIKKNSIKIEAIEKKIDIISQVQTSHKEQNEKSFENTELAMKEKANVMEMSIKSISKDV